MINSYVFETMNSDGRRITPKIAIAAKLPYAVKIIASYPKPFFNISCPGRIDSSVSVSGHPRNIEGIKSINVWVIAMLEINTTRHAGFIEKKIVAENETKKAPMRFM